MPLGVVGEDSGEFREAFGDGAVVTFGVGAAIGVREDAAGVDAAEDEPLTAGATGTLGAEAIGTETPAAAGAAAAGVPGAACCFVAVACCDANAVSLVAGAAPQPTETSVPTPQIAARRIL